MAQRRKRISVDQVDGFLKRLKSLPIEVAHEPAAKILELPGFARSCGLTNYDAAYLSLARIRDLPLATNDADLRKAAISAGVAVVAA